MIIEPADVLRQKADMRDRLDTPGGAGVVVGQIAQMYETDDLEMIRTIVRALYISVALARAYRVEGHMTSALMRRAEALDDDEKVGFPPTDHGFVVFEEPLDLAIRSTDVVEKIHVVTWKVLPREEFKNADKDGILLSLWTDTSRDPDGTHTLVLPGRETNAEDARMANSLGRWTMANIGSFSPQWDVGPINGTGNDTTPAPGLETTGSIIRLFTALFAMLSERIPAVNKIPATLNRTETRQARRAGIEPEVILVTLRPEYRDPTQRGTGHPISVRYPLGNPDDPHSVAFYRTIHRGTERERRVPVRAHWRGRPDAPVSERKTVYNLAR